ncbi:type VII secretion protein EccB [Nocardiopsis coralliicola]
MQTRRDQVQAHSFMVRRLSTAMAAADPNAVEAPLRRTRNFTLVGLILAVLLCIGFLVFGLIFPGGATSWRTEGTVVAVKGGAGRFVYSEGALWPVANQTSALLLSEGTPPTQVAADSLEGTPVGTPLGIAGAPDSLPSAEPEGTLTWQVCATAVDTGQGNGPEPLTSLTLGRSAAGSPLGDGEAVLVEGPGGGHHLLWGGTRMRLDTDAGALESLGYGTAAAHPASAALLEAVPPGPELTPPEIAGRGDRGPALADGATRIGQVFSVPGEDGGAAQYYVLTEDGLAPTDSTVARLLLGDPRTARDAYAGADPEPAELSVAEVRANLAEDDARVGEEGTPQAPPQLAEPQGAAVCAVEQGQGAPVFALMPPAEIGGRAARPPSGTTAACSAPDLVDIPAGEGGIVRAVPAGGSALSAAYFLVTDAGAKYPLPDSAAAESLGYSVGAASEAATPLLDLLPTGPELSPQAASEPAGTPEEPGEPSCPSP